MFVQMIFSESLNFLLGMVIHHYEPDCLSKRWVFIFKVKVTVKNNIIKIWLFNILSEPFATKLGLMIHHYWVDHLVTRFVVVRVTENVQNSSECSSGQYLLNCWTFVTKLGMVRHHHGPECQAKDWFAIFKVKVTVRAHIIKYDCF